MVEVLAAFLVGEQPLDVRRNRDQPGDLAAVGTFPECSRNLQPVHLGQVEIEKRHIVVARAQRLQRLQPVGRDIDLMAALVEQELQQLVGDGAVLGHQHLAPSDGLCGGRQVFGSDCCHLRSSAGDLSGARIPSSGRAERAGHAIQALFGGRATNFPLA